MLVVVVLGIFLALNLREDNSIFSKDEKPNTEAQSILSKDVDRNYPATVREVVRLFARISKCYHNETISDEEFQGLVEMQRKLFDEEFLEKANIKEWEKVEILDINNGERFQTYALKGVRGSKCFCVNGAAARKVQAGDKIIIVTYAQMSEEEIKTHKPTIVQVGENNEIISYGK